MDIEITPVADLKELKLTIDKKTLNKDTNTTYTIEPIFDKGEIPQELKEKIENITLESDIEDSIKTDKTTKTITALKDGNITIFAKVDNIVSNKETLDVYWEVDGHRLPPEPDPAINNATLLGIDANNNGVRDDVERWIYNKYKDKHPIYIDIAMQAARGYKLVLETPDRAKEIHDEVDKAIYCQGYYKYSAEYYNEPILIKENAIDEYFRSKIYFNTKERHEAYIKYDTLLSGDSYTLPSDQEKKAACDFNTSKYDKE